MRSLLVVTPRVIKPTAFAVAIAMSGGHDIAHADGPHLDGSAVPMVPATPSVSDETVLALARVCFSEADMHRGDDCAAIAEVTRKRAARSNRSLLEQLRAYSPEATGQITPRSMRQRWISGLRLDGAEPPAWAEMNEARRARGLLRLPWTRYGFRWRELLQEARRLLLHPRRVCSEPPDHWGGDCNPDANPHGVCDVVPPTWRRVDCGRTVNAFYTISDTPRRPRVVPAHRARGGRPRRR